MVMRTVDVITVVIVDAERAFSQALAYRLNAEPLIDVIETAGSSAAGEASIARLKPNVAVLDASLWPEGVTTAAERLCSLHPDLRLVVVSPIEDVQIACDAVRAGASSFLTKDSSVDEMIAAISGAVHGESRFDPCLLTRVLHELRHPHKLSEEDDRLRELTPREREVLDCMTAGLDRAAIARELVLSINTVRTHTRRILAKLGTHSSLEAVSVALRAGVVPRQIGQTSRDPALGGTPSALVS
jgi:DNA-binding NarL/FixJ family response regulator